MWATIAKLVGGPLIKKGFNWLMGKQEERKHARELNAEWELAAMKRSSTLLRVTSFVTILGPIYHAYFLVMWNTPMENPQDVANAIQTVFSSFPEWYTGLAVAMLLAIWGKKEMDTGTMSRIAAEKDKNKAENNPASNEKPEFLKDHS